MDLSLRADISAVLFDVFGTVVDWRTSIIRQLREFGATFGVSGDWERVADDWRGEYRPSMDAVLDGSRPWVPLDLLNRETLELVLGRHDIAATPAQLDDLARAWHRLDPWPDAVAGLTRLRQVVRIGTLSNGNTAALDAMARHGGLPWDVLLGAEVAQTYKPAPELYLRNVSALGLAPHQVMLVAAHNGDLAAASVLGVRTCFVPRPTEWGTQQTRDLTPTGPWDLVVDDLLDLAARFTQPPAPG